MLCHSKMVPIIVSKYTTTQAQLRSRYLRRTFYVRASFRICPWSVPQLKSNIPNHFRQTSTSNFNRYIAMASEFRAVYPDDIYHAHVSNSDLLTCLSSFHPQLVRYASIELRRRRKVCNTITAAHSAEHM